MSFQTADGRKFFLVIHVSILVIQSDSEGAEYIHVSILVIQSDSEGSEYIQVDVYTNAFQILRFALNDIMGGASNDNGRVVLE